MTRASLADVILRDVTEALDIDVIRQASSVHTAVHSRFGVRPQTAICSAGSLGTQTCPNTTAFGDTAPDGRVSANTLGSSRRCKRQVAPLGDIGQKRPTFCRAPVRFTTLRRSTAFGATALLKDSYLGTLWHCSFSFGSGALRGVRATCVR
jgi:hypothetical protein